LNHASPLTAPAAAAGRARGLPQALWLLLALAYYLSACLAHLPFSLWLVRQRDTVLGPMALADLVPGAAGVAALALAAWVGWQLRHSTRPWAVAALWLLWLASVGLVDRFLTFSTNEYAHYPQYALLAWLLAQALDRHRCRRVAGRLLFWTTLLGMGDELLQYLWTTTGYSNYLDFNDFLTNLLAAAAGLLLFYGAAPASAPPLVSAPASLPLQEPTPASLPPLASAPARGQPVAAWWVSAALAGLVLTGLQSGHIGMMPAQPVPPGGLVQRADGRWCLYLQRSPDFYGSVQPGPHQGQYLVLPPWPGLLIMLGLGLAFARADCASATARRPSPAPPDRLQNL